MTSTTSGKLHGCHPTKEAARKQQAAMYVHAPPSEGKEMEIELEQRQFEIRMTVDANNKPMIEGHAAVFNKPSEEIFFVPGWREIIRPGAFLNAIKNSDVRALVNHDNSQLIGRTSNGSLMLKEDEEGLFVRIFPPDTAVGRDVVTLIRGKFMSAMSFGFSVEKELINQADKMREIISVKKLYDVSPVTMPAYPQTDVAVRAFYAAKFGQELQGDELEIEPGEIIRKVSFQDDCQRREAFLKEREPKPEFFDVIEIIKQASH